jgi:quinoprotein glucose dehydrogenase
VTGEIGLHSTPTVVNNTVLVGSSFKEGSQPLEANNTKGLTRAFDVKTGKLLWTFHNIPQKGEFGYDSWKNNSADFNGNTGTWASMTVDPELNSVYVPIEDPTNDAYGGARPGNDLFGDSLVCLDLTTGKMKWYYQIVHHPIWDYDMSSPPLLVNITHDGKTVKAVAVPSKEANLYVFDRVTGKPIWPIVEKPVPQSAVPGEETSKTQPFPTKPQSYARNAITTDDLIDFTPELRAKAVDIIKKILHDGPDVLARRSGQAGRPLRGHGYRHSRRWHQLARRRLQSGNPCGLCTRSQCRCLADGSGEPPPEGLTDNKYLEGTAGQPFRINGGSWLRLVLGRTQGQRR